LRPIRLALVSGVAVAAAIVAYLCIPGHWLGTFFYNAAPPLFRQTVSWEQSSNALQQSNGQLLWTQVQNHVQVSLISAAIAIGICFPLGVAASRSWRIRAFARKRHLAVGFLRRISEREVPVRSTATNLVGIVRAVPGIAVIFLIYPFVGQGELPGVIALTLLASPPIFLNTVAGYAGVDRAVVESARGMGMNRPQIFGRIETPLAAAVVIAGIRIAMVEIIASATILAYSANYDTLGTQISYGLDDLGNLYHGRCELAVGISLVAAMALGAELLLSLVQRAVAPARR